MATDPSHVIILAHPDPNSFNGAVAKSYCEVVEGNYQTFIIRDLYASRFDPVLKANELPHRADYHLSDDVAAELALIGDADVFVMIFPIWFGMPPAMMTGYIDRVLGAGVTAQQVRKGAAASVMTGRHLVCITTSGTGQPWLDGHGQIESLKTLLGRYLLHAFGLQGVEHLHLADINPESPTMMEVKLHQVRERARKVCAEVALRKHRAAAIATATP